MNNITMIKVEQLYHHPENPRKDLGDLSELTESIRKNGIMQNLTVVPGHRMTKAEWVAEARAEGADKVSAESSYDPENAEVSTGYTVVIGNRRMEAAKAAGLAEVPCVISGMDHKEQIATMLEENMQRADLTVYEQAQGFQMMMDLGYSAQEISEKTGFSETTVGRRLKMAQLDKKTFQAAVGKQITVEVLDQLGKIDDIGKRNELLANYGDNNFDWQVIRAIREQQAKKMKPAAKRMLNSHEPKLKQIPTEDRYNLWNKFRKLHNETLELYDWDGKSEFIPKADEPLYWLDAGTDIEFYIKEKKEKKEAEKKTPAEIEKEKKIDLAWKTADRVARTAAELRENFAKGLTVKPSNAMQMLRWAIIASLSDWANHKYCWMQLKAKFELGGEYTWDYVDDLERKLTEMPQKEWPGLILMLFEGLPMNDQVESFASGYRRDWPKWQRNTRLEQCYKWLTEFGYKMSDEEIRMMSGQHECFGKGGAAE